MFLALVNQTFSSKMELKAGVAMPLASKNFLSNQYNGRHALEVYNSGTAPVFVGGSDVSTDTGIAINAGVCRVFPVSDVHAIYVLSEQDASVVLAEYC